MTSHPASSHPASNRPVNLCSDNVTGVAPGIMEAIQRANSGPQAAYGADAVTARLEDRFAEVFECPVTVLPVATGTAANVLGLSLVTPPWGAIYCHRGAHIQEDECGAPEFFTGGAKLVLVEGADGKMAAADLEAAIGGAGIVHHVQPASVSIAQASEAGRVYPPREIAALSEVCKRHGLALQMDGARFANALVSLGVSPAEATWKAGVDILAFGATKNGALAAEAVLLFGETRAKSEELQFRRKRGGHLFSKMRFLSAQLEAYLEGDLWLANARKANAMAARLAEGLGALEGVEFLYPVEANELFLRLPAGLIEGLRAEGHLFYDWGRPGDREIRLVTGFWTEAEEIEAFLASARRLAGADAA